MKARLTSRFGREGQELEHRQIGEARNRLREIAEMGLRPPASGRDIVAGDRGGATIRLQAPGEQAQNGRLARAVAPRNPTISPTPTSNETSMTAGRP